MKLAIKGIILSVLCLFGILRIVNAQVQDPSEANDFVDSVTHLREVTVEGYISEQPWLKVPTSVGIVYPDRLQFQGDASLLPAINAVPGVRMEERSEARRVGKEGV